MKPAEYPYNPYDFSNPVSNRNLFSGRGKELEEIEYYLKQSMNAPRPVNLALLGPRASGKTSLLNMIELRATDLGFCVARINLNEGDTQSELAFFFKLFDEVFSAVCSFERESEAGVQSLCFEGIYGRTHETYLDMVTVYEVPEDKTWCPFLFPIHYAKSMSKGMHKNRVSDHHFIGDLLKISQELKHPIAILFDECNVLSEHRVLLEMLRNIFLNLPGYMLVFTGTPDLFPVMDEVFSPLVRQFKKIDVGSFESEADVKACVHKPLESIGIEPSEVIGEDTLSELQKTTSGKPYEIQLICHFMFRRIKPGEKMKLSLAVLDDILSELTQGHDIDLRPTIRRVKSLNNRQMEAFGLLTICDGRATFDQLWFIEYLFPNAGGLHLSSARNLTRWANKEALSDELRNFEAQQIVKLSDGIITFAGDDFDRIYLKYYARQRKIDLSFDGLSITELMNLNLSFVLASQAGLQPLSPIYAGLIRLFHKNVDRLVDPIPFPAISMDKDRFREALLSMLDPMEARDVYETHPQLASVLYWIWFYSKEEAIEFVTISVVGPGLNADYHFYAKDGGARQRFRQFNSELDLIKKRATELGGEVIVTNLEAAVIPTDVLNNGVLGSKNSKLRKSIADVHFSNMRDAYVNEHDLDTARFNGNIGYLLNASPDEDDLASFVYILLLDLDYTRAKDLLTPAVEGQPQNTSALAYYNFAIAQLGLGEFRFAPENLRRAISIEETTKATYACLLVPSIINGELVMQERMSPDLCEAAREALSVIFGILSEDDALREDRTSSEGTE